MGVVRVVAGVVVGLAFVIAGASKLAVGEGWRHQAAALGAPPWSVRPLPWVELVVGAGLLARLAWPVPVWAAVGLLVAFSALIVARIREGHRPPCACFGAWSSTPIGPVHLIRNAVLLALAILAL